MTELRNRLVVDTMGEQHVSSLLLAVEDIPEALDIERRLHEATGWTVSDYGQSIRFEKGDLIRWVWVRSRPPLEDQT
jgi:hypothetical protein